LKPTLKLATSQTPDGSEMVLYQHDTSFCIRIDGHVLMDSKQHESELALARLGCDHLAPRREPAVLIGGLGLGFTLRQCLDMVGPHASVVVSELMSTVIQWNREYLGELAGHPLRDKRVKVQQGDILELLYAAEEQYDAILLDVDNGPSAMTDSSNCRLYGKDGIDACLKALKKRGCLSVWSASPDKNYERMLQRAGLHVRLYPVSCYKGSRSQSRYVWVASRDKNLLPFEERPRK
jgi:spermidine synthase